MAHCIEIVGLLPVTAAIVTVIARRSFIPYPVGLVAAGLCLGFLSNAPALGRTRDPLFGLLLPPLIFEAAMCLPWRSLRRELPVVAALATARIVVSMAVTCYAMYQFSGCTPLAAPAFGAPIAATDPVSAIATFRDLGMKGRLRSIVEVESLLNGATAAVLFASIVAFAANSLIFLLIGMQEAHQAFAGNGATALAVVTFSVVVQGLSMPPLLRRLGFVRDDREWPFARRVRRPRRFRASE